MTKAELEKELRKASKELVQLREIATTTWARTHASGEELIDLEVRLHRQLEAWRKRRGR